MKNKPDCIRTDDTSNIHDRMFSNRKLTEIAKTFNLSRAILVSDISPTDKMLADHMEAVVGAISLDMGFEGAYKFIIHFWKTYLDQELSNFLSVQSRRLFCKCPIEQYCNYTIDVDNANINNVGKRGDTPIMMFLRDGNRRYIDNIVALYKASANLDKPNRFSETAWQLIESNPHQEKTKYQLGFITSAKLVDTSDIDNSSNIVK